MDKNTFLAKAKNNRVAIQAALNHVSFDSDVVAVVNELNSYYVATEFDSELVIVGVKLDADNQVVEADTVCLDTLLERNPVAAIAVATAIEED